MEYVLSIAHDSFDAEDSYTLIGPFQDDQSLQKFLNKADKLDNGEMRQVIECKTPEKFLEDCAKLIKELDAL